MRAFLGFGFAVLASTACAFEGEPALLPGGTAPKVTVASWIKGSAPAKPGLHVVEFWATWCGPCKTSIPHLTELSHKYKGKVDFYGISVYERMKNIPEAVADFVKAMGDKMDYNVAIDSTGKEMAKNWMEAAEQHGIPTAFIVDASDKVLWIGHPMLIDEPLEKAIAGKLDWKPERERIVADAAKYRKANEGRTAAKAAIALFEAGKVDEAEKEFDRIALLSERDRQLVQGQRILLYIKHKDAKRDPFISKLIAGNSGDQALAAQVAFQQSEPTGDEALARSVAAQLAEKSTDTVALYYTSMAYSKLEDHKLALDVAEKALKAYAADVRFKNNPKFKETIANLRDSEKAKVSKQ